MFNLSSAMAGQFAAAATEMAEQVSVLGPNPLRDDIADPAGPDKIISFEEEPTMLEEKESG